MCSNLHPYTYVNGSHWFYEKGPSAIYISNQQTKPAEQGLHLMRLKQHIQISDENRLFHCNVSDKYIIFLFFTLGCSLSTVQTLERYKVIVLDSPYKTLYYFAIYFAIKNTFQDHIIFFLSRWCDGHDVAKAFVILCCNISLMDQKIKGSLLKSCPMWY